MKWLVALNGISVGTELLLSLALRYFLVRHTTKAELIFYYSTLDLIVFLTMFHTGFKDAVIRSFHQYNESSKILSLFKKSFIYLAIVLSSLFIPLFYGHFMGDGRSLGIIQYLFAFLCYFASLFYLLINYYLMLYQRHKQVSYISFSKNILLIAIIFSLYFFNSHYTGSVLIGANVVSNTLSALLFFKYIPISYKSHAPDSVARKDFFKYVGYGSAEYGLGYISLYLSTVLYVRYFSSDDLAGFQIVSRPIYTALLSVFSYPIYRVLFPDIVSKIVSGNYSHLLRQNKNFYIYTFVLGVLLISGSHLFGRTFVIWFFSSNYAGAEQSLNILIWAVPFAMVNAYTSAVIKGSGNFRVGVLIRFLGALCFFALFFIFMHFNLGPNSIVYAITVSVILSATASFFTKQRIISKWQSKTIHECENTKTV